MIWRITESDIRFFRAELWKDERNFTNLPPMGSNEFGKHCFTPQRAQLEYEVLDFLSTTCPGLCPSPREVRNDVLIMENVRGIRLYDLLRELQTIELRRRDGRAFDALSKLLTRAKNQLATIQRALFGIQYGLSVIPYPIDSKLGGLLSFLSNIFDTKDQFQAAEKDITRLSEYWRKNCCVVPFRDATAKNMFFADPAFQLSKIFTSEARTELIEASIEAATDDIWVSTPLIDVDFSSVEHSTSPEDDPISLLHHEWTDTFNPLSSQQLVLCPELWSPNSFRAAATLLVRYMRFGGRKLAYKVINNQGFQVRFRYDDPLFYFSNLLRRCGTLDANFASEYCDILCLIETIGGRARNPSPGDVALSSLDHFRRIYPDHGHYWQERPNEQL